MCSVQGPNYVRFEVTCDVHVPHDAPVDWEGPGDDPCNPVFTATHRGGCSWNSAKSLEGLKKFSGAVLIIVGAIMAFIGARFIIWVLGFLIFAAIQGIFFTVSYSAGFVDPYALYRSSIEDGSTAAVAVIIALLGVVLGCVAAKYLINFAALHLVPILAFVCGSLIGFMLTATLPLDGDLIYVKILLDGACGGVAAYFSYRANQYIKTVGTAVIGSFMLFKGIGTIRGDFPRLLDNIQSGAIDQSELDKAMDGDLGDRATLYLVGTVLVSIIGSYVQLKITCKEIADDDMMNKVDS